MLILTASRPRLGLYERYLFVMQLTEKHRCYVRVKGENTDSFYWKEFA